MNAGEINILLLAAGSSSRMGQSKQLLKVNNDTLLALTTKTALTSSVNKVLVVLGYDYQKHMYEIKDLPVETVYHPEWEKGIGSSLKAGLKHMLTICPETKAVIVLVCDQPYLSSEHLTAIITRFSSTQSSIIASKYADTLGVPALFDHSIFWELFDMGDEEGAKKIINRHIDQVISIEFPEGTIDLDTPSDFRRYLNKLH